MYVCVYYIIQICVPILVGKATTYVNRVTFHQYIIILFQTLCFIEFNLW